MGLIVWSHFHIVYVAGKLKGIKWIEDQMPDEEVIEERRLKIQVKVIRKGKNRKNNDDGSVKEGDGDHLGIANLEDDTTNT